MFQNKNSKAANQKQDVKLTYIKTQFTYIFYIVFDLHLVLVRFNGIYFIFIFSYLIFFIV